MKKPRNVDNKPDKQVSNSKNFFDVRFWKEYWEEEIDDNEKKSKTKDIEENLQVTFGHPFDL